MITDTHRESQYKYIVVSDAEDHDDFSVHYVCKGNGFKFHIVATLHSYEEAEEMAIAMNYWETRPMDINDGA
jgi:hypothetical protein